MAKVSNFDFLHGSWDVHNRRLVKRLARCTEWEEFSATMTCQALFGGAANIDEFWFPSRHSYGMTIRVEQPNGEWSIWWVSSTDGALQPVVVGRFHDDELVAYGDDSHEHTPVKVRYYHWSAITDNTARWEQAFSADGGNSWEPNWIMEFTRR